MQQSHIQLENEQQKHKHDTQIITPSNYPFINISKLTRKPPHVVKLTTIQYTQTKEKLNTNREICPSETKKSTCKFATCYIDIHMTVWTICKLLYGHVHIDLCDNTDLLKLPPAIFCLLISVYGLDQAPLQHSNFAS